MNIDRQRGDALEILTLAAERFPSPATINFYSKADLDTIENMQGLPPEAEYFYDLVVWLINHGYLASGVVRPATPRASFTITEKGLSALGLRLFDEIAR